MTTDKWTPLLRATASMGKWANDIRELVRSNRSLLEDLERQHRLLRRQWEMNAEIREITRRIHWLATSIRMDGITDARVLQEIAKVAKEA